MCMIFCLIGLGLVVVLFVVCGKQDVLVVDVFIFVKDKVISVLVSNVLVEVVFLCGMLDFGGIIQVVCEVDGIGSILELVVLVVLQLVVVQVNGVCVVSQMQSLCVGLYVDVDDEYVGDICVDVFIQQMIVGLQGVVLGYEILLQDEVWQLDEEIIVCVCVSDEGWSFKGFVFVSVFGEVVVKGGGVLVSVKECYDEKVSVDVKCGVSLFDFDVIYCSMCSYWKVCVCVQIVQYCVLDEQGKLKIVVVLLCIRVGSYVVGDGCVSVDEVVDVICVCLFDMLIQIQCFIVLDCEFGDELQVEIDYINSGNVCLQDIVCVGQQLVIDLILILIIECFEYLCSVCNLCMFDCQVILYFGGGCIILCLINVIIGQVVMFDSFDYQLVLIGFSILLCVVNGCNMVVVMMELLFGQIGISIVIMLFLVLVVLVDGDQVVLSQGGDVVQVGQCWQVVCLGEELKDLQIGCLLGCSEYLCCIICIDCVVVQILYGIIEDGVDVMCGGFCLGQIELCQKLGSKLVVVVVVGGIGLVVVVVCLVVKLKFKFVVVLVEDLNW